MRKVNLGCGLTVHREWINIDNSFNARLARYPLLRRVLFEVGILSEETYQIPWEEHIDDVRLLDVTDGLPFDRDTIDFIYSSHLIEHLELNEAMSLLEECHHVLQPGGVMRIATPDLERFCRKYIDLKESFGQMDSSGTTEFVESFVEQIPSNEFLQRTGLPVQVRRSSLLNRLIKQTVRRGHTHKWLYDEQSLSALLEYCGFEDVSRREFMEGEVPDIEFLDNREDHSLYMEAKKPGNS